MAGAPIFLHLTGDGPVVEYEGVFYPASGLEWDDLFSHDDPRKLLDGFCRGEPVRTPSILRAPIGSQEVWAAGVTYYRSREARMHEAKDAGGGDFYDRVYDAARPELFFKSSPHRTAASGEAVYIRKDARWNVPEPEFTLALNAAGRIFGCTVGNDMSSRDIEGENPLYLPQAKVYDRSCAIGPRILVSEELPPPSTEIRLEILRGGRQAFADATALSQMKRTCTELAEYLFRSNSFPNGCYLMTGTGIVPPDDFTLEPGDEVRITIEPIGTLVNRVEIH